jgi:P27 family predicted phage terminase small subunit
MGRPRIPTALKEHEGTYREDRDGGTLKLRLGVPAKPKWLDEVAGMIWDETVDELLETPGLLTYADGAVLALYCDAWRQYHEFDEQIRRDGNTIESLTAGKKAHPLLNRRDAARSDAVKIGALFGLNPSARASMKLQPTVEEDEFAALIA